MYRIFDTEFRRVVRGDLETLEDAERCLGELLKADPGAEDVLRILVPGQGAGRKTDLPGLLERGRLSTPAGQNAARAAR